MQLNIYVPKSQRPVIEALDRRAKHTGRPKNTLILEAISEYLKVSPHPPKTDFPVFYLGVGDLPGRADLYEQWLPHRS